MWSNNKHDDQSSDQEKLAGLSVAIVDGCRKVYEGQPEGSARVKQRNDKGAARSECVADAAKNLVEGVAAGGVYR